MADIDEKADKRLVSTEKQTLQAQPDTQAARHARPSDLKAVQALNRNAHSGTAGGDQNESIELVAFKDEGGYDLLAAREMPEIKEKLPNKKTESEQLTADFLRDKAQGGDIWARSFIPEMERAERLPAGPIRDQELENVLKKAAVIFRPEQKGKAEQPSEDQMNTGTLLAAEATKNPVAEPVKQLNNWVEKQPDGPSKEAFRQEVRQQAAELSPEMKARMDHLAKVRQKIEAAGLEQGGVHEAIRPDQKLLQGKAVENENEWQGFTRLTPKQQRAVIEAFQGGSNIAQEAYEQKIQAVAESVPKGFYNVGKGLYDSAIAAGAFTIEAAQRPEKLQEAAQKLSESLSVAIVSGVKISEVTVGYTQEMARSGDYSPLMEELKTVTTMADDRWTAMPLEKRTEKASELIADMGIGSVIGATDRLAKSGKLIDALEDLANYAKDLTAPGREKAKQAIGAFLDDIFQPKGLTTNGFEMPIPKQKADDLVLLKKGDKGLPEGVKPSDKVSLSERVNTAGYVMPEIIVPKEVYEAAAVQGFSREVVDQKLQIVAEALQNAFARIGNYDPRIHGTERAYGNLLHEQMRQNLLKVGDKAIHPEASYLKQTQADWGKLGTSRVDLSLGDRNRPFVSICLKTLKASPSAQQERGWVKNLPRLDDGAVPPRLYLKLPKPGE